MKWIPVEEQMPEYGVRVLTNSPKAVFVVGIHALRRMPYIDIDWWMGVRYHTVEENVVTHWMPLPPPEDAKRMNAAGAGPNFVVGRWYFYRRRGWADCSWGSNRVAGWEIGLGDTTCYGGNEQWVWSPTLLGAIRKAREDLL